MRRPVRLAQMTRDGSRWLEVAPRLPRGCPEVAVPSAFADMSRNISIDFESNGATSYFPSSLGRSLPPDGATQMHFPPSVISCCIVFITIRLCLDDNK